MNTTEWAADGDPADVAEQRTPVIDDDAADLEPFVIEEVGEADPADVIEQAIVVGGDDDGYDRG